MKENIKIKSLTPQMEEARFTGITSSVSPGGGDVAGVTVTQHWRDGYGNKYAFFNISARHEMDGGAFMESVAAFDGFDEWKRRTFSPEAAHIWSGMALGDAANLVGAEGIDSAEGV